MWGEFNGNQYGGLPWAELWIKTLWWTTLKPSSADRSNWSTFKGGPKYSGRTVPKWSFHLVSNRNLGFWAEWEEPEPVRSEVHYINAQSFLYLNFHLLAIFSLCSLLASNFSLSSSLHFSFDQEVVTAFDRYHHYSLPLLMFSCSHLLKDGHLVNLFLQV